MAPFLSVVIPAYNEAGNILAGSLDSVAAYLSSQTYEHEVLVVDDGSTDETLSLVEAFAAGQRSFRVIHNPHRGKAFTVATGLRAARGEIVLFTDMDQATPIEETAKLLPWFAQGYDVVIGSRGTYRRNAPLWRKFMSRSQILLRSLILGFKDITDTQCGFKAFRGSTIAPILSHLYLYNLSRLTEAKGATVTAGFDVELLFVAQRLGYRIREVPVTWDYRHSRRVNLLKDSLRGLRELIEIRAAELRGAYDRPGHPRLGRSGR